MTESMLSKSMTAH